MLKNVLALIGLVTVVNAGIKGFNQYLKQPLERALADAFDDELTQQAKKPAADPESVGTA